MVNEKHVRSVVFVEDDPGIFACLNELFSIENIQAAGFTNASDALAHLTAKKSPDVILLDLMLPGELTAGDLVKRLRQLPAPACNTPVLVLSADSAVERTAAAIGAQGFLRKPIEIDLLLQTIAEYSSMNKAVALNPPRDLVEMPPHQLSAS